MVRAKLDRAVCDVSWANSFPSARVRHEHRAASDHGVLWVELQPSYEANVRR
ncbi:UNVERIFIED_CONTAM: hypothetical protein Slati_0434200 [Sesamum latifolium]|uniref:Endonuclease/exonuclease/phosphatase n=1 Tax=Sesamum latifolium TaxID=2727402 RepID=A0AAW2Y0B3_9LAMI